MGLTVEAYQGADGHLPVILWIAGVKAARPLRLGAPGNRLPPTKIAIVDDDEAFRHALGFLVESLGQANDAYASAEDFLAAGPQAYIGLIADGHMLRASGLKLAQRLRDSGAALPTFLLSADLTTEIIDAARAVGIAHIGGKPVSIDALRGFLASLG